MSEPFDLDKFGKIMDAFIKDNHIQMLIDMPEGTIEPTVTDNAKLGGVVQFYILLNAVKPIYKLMCANLGGKDKFDYKEFLKNILNLLRTEIIEEMEDGNESNA